MSQDTSRRRMITAATLVAAGAVVAVMAIWGVNAATAPVEDDDTTAVSTDGPTCPPEEQSIKKFITRGEVTVSVYNTGKRTGRAGDTLTLLEDAGFRAGEIGNAEDKVARAEVRTTKKDDPRAELLARALGRNTAIVVTDQAYGPGLDVFIGDKFNGLNKKAPARLKLADAVITCK